MPDVQQQLNEAVSTFVISIRQIISEQLKRDRPAATLALDNPFCLTPRECQITRLIIQGLQNKEIADRIGISSRGVKFHVRNILLKHSIQTRFDLRKTYLEEK